MTEFVAALDGGGTKTLGAYATRAGDVTYTRATSGCNAQDNAEWRIGLDAALAQFPQFSHATLGLPGYGEIASLDGLLRRHVDAYFGLTSPSSTMTLLNDVELAYRGAFPVGGGVLVLAGTGSMAMTSDAASIIRTGGWGDLFGDEGSAFWIGRLGLQLASQMRDGRLQDTGFADRLSAKLGIGQDDGFFGLSAWAIGQQHSRSAIANVSMYINALSDEGDVTAQAVLDAAAAQLALHVTTVARLARLPATFDWAHAGSAFRSHRLLDAVTQNLGKPSIPRQFDALGGGLWLAAQAAGWQVDTVWADRIRQGLDQKATDWGAPAMPSRKSVCSMPEG